MFFRGFRTSFFRFPLRTPVVYLFIYSLITNRSMNQGLMNHRHRGDGGDVSPPPPALENRGDDPGTFSRREMGSSAKIADFLSCVGNARLSKTTTAVKEVGTALPFHIFQFLHDSFFLNHWALCSLGASQMSTMGDIPLSVLILKIYLYPRVNTPGKYQYILIHN